MSKLKSRPLHPHTTVGALVADHEAELAERWRAAGERLREVNPTAFAELLALGHAYVAWEDRTLESLAAFESRLVAIGGAS